MTQSPDSCAPADLIAIYPWVLSNIISGHPQLFRPFVVEARYAAEMRNYYWQHLNSGAGNRAISLATGVGPYPSKSDQIADKAVDDGGGNFARLARTTIMDTYKTATDAEGVAGIPVGLWRQFFKAFVDSQDMAGAGAAIERLVRSITPAPKRLSDEQLDGIGARLREIADILKPN